MFNDEFYRLVDEEIDNLLSKCRKEELSKKDLNAKKSYGFLLWFLKRYLPNIDIEQSKEYITEGTDDSSCDLILENEFKGKKIFYVIQSKWFASQKSKSIADLGKEFRACLTDFHLVLDGKKNSETNTKFNERYGELKKHKANNGKIKFVFLALASFKDSKVEEYLQNFSKSSLVSIEIMDILSLKQHYAEKEYKGIKTSNPLEELYETKDKISLTIEKENHLNLKKLNLPEAYIFIIKPSQIYSLFEKYGFGIFYKNIRNPLPKSLYNPDIVNTLKNNPGDFWYFNNGITAITENIEDFHPDTEKIDVEGIQIINGAQTVYSIHEVYKNSSESEKVKLDRDAKICFRLLRTRGKDLDTKITRYTNSQNPITLRDFYSNEEIQKYIQNLFFHNTKYLYEIRRGEYRKKPKEHKIISNEKFSQTYLAYWLQKPLDAKSNKKQIFIKEEGNKRGFYELIFNESINYINMLISYLLYQKIESKRKSMKLLGKTKKSSSKGFIQYASFEILALFKILQEDINSKSLQGLSNKILDRLGKDDKFFEDRYVLITNILSNYMKTQSKDISLSSYFKEKDTYPKLKDFFIARLRKEKISELIL